MNWSMLAVLGILLAVAFSPSSWSDEEEMVASCGVVPDDALPEPVLKAYGSRSLRGFRRLTPRHFRALYPGCALFEIKVYNPRTVIAGPDYYTHAAIEHEGSYRFISNDAGAVEVIAQSGLPVPDLVSAVSRVLAFAELRCYPLQLRGPQPTAETPQPQSWSLTVAEQDAGWEISCVMMTAPQTQTCVRYTLRVTTAGGFSIQKTEVLSSSGGYR